MRVCFCCVWFSFSVLSQEIGREERLRNELFCVGWNVNLKLINESSLFDFVDNIPKTDVARITKRDTELFHDESWKPICFGVKRAKVKGTK